MKTKQKRIKFKDAKLLDVQERILIYLGIRKYIIKKSAICALFVSPLLMFSVFAALAFNYNTPIKISIITVFIIAAFALYTPITLMLLRELKAVKKNDYQYHIGKLESDDVDHSGFKGFSNVIVVDSMQCDCVHDYKNNKKNEKYIVIRTSVGRMPLAIKYNNIKIKDDD